MTTAQLRERKRQAVIRCLYARCWGTTEEIDSAHADLEEVSVELREAIEG